MGSIAKITVETNVMFYGSRRMPYLRGFRNTRPLSERLEVELRNGTPKPYPRPLPSEREIAEFRDYQRLGRELVEVSEKICWLRPVEEEP